MVAVGEGTDKAPTSYRHPFVKPLHAVSLALLLVVLVLLLVVLVLLAILWLPTELQHNPYWTGHVANVATCISFLVSDVLWLRVLATTANIFTILFSYYNPVGQPLWLPLQWSTLYICVNLVYIARILRDRIVFLTPTEQRAYDEHFEGSLSQPDFARLVRSASLVHAHAPKAVLHEGVPATRLLLLVEGFAEVQVGEGVIVDVGPGLLGEAAFSAGGVATATVKVRSLALHVARYAPRRCKAKHCVARHGVETCAP